MARFNGSVTRNASHYSCYINVEEADVSITDNTSKVTVSLYIYRSQYGWITSNAQGGNIVIDGTKFNFSYTPNWPAGSTGTALIATASKVITHNQDGSRDCAVSATWSTSGTYSCGTASASGTLTLTKIARFAEILTAPNFTDEDNPTITYKNPAGTSVDILQACIAEPSGNRSIIVPYRDISKTGTSYTFNLTDDERLALRNYTTTSATKEIGFYVRSVIGSGDSRPQLTRTLTITNANPTFSDFSIEDNNDSTYGLTGDRNKFIKKYSNAKVTISTTNKMTALKQATPDKYLLVNGSKAPISVAYSSTEDVSGIVNNVDVAVFSVSAVDSRNLQTTISKTLDMLDYNDPLIQTFNIHRVDGAGTKAVFSMSGTYSNINFGTVTNTITSAKVRYKKKTATSYSDWTDITALIQLNQGEFSANNVTINSIDFELGSKYDVQIIIIDKLSEAVQQGNIDDGTVLMAALKGNGVAFGGVYQKSLGGAVQVYGDWLLNEKSLKGEVLYENAAGETSSVSLSKSVSEFAVIDIFYINFDGYYNSVRVENPNGKTAQLLTCSPNSSANGTYFRVAMANISGSTIALSNQMQSWIQNTTAQAASLSTAIKIVKVIGYYDTLAINYTEKKEIQTDNSIITVGLTADVQKTTQDYTVIPWNRVYAQKGNNLTLNDGAITIGEGISYVKVSANIAYSNPVAQVPLLQVWRNGESLYTSGVTATSAWENLNDPVTPALIPVSEGDIIRIAVHPNNSNGVYVRVRSYMTVEMI